MAWGLLLVPVEHLGIVDYPIDDLELENFVVRNSQRMSLRLYNKRRPLDQNASSASPAVKRYKDLSYQYYCLHVYHRPPLHVVTINRNHLLSYGLFS